MIPGLYPSDLFEEAGDLILHARLHPVADGHAMAGEPGKHGLDVFRDDERSAAQQRLAALQSNLEEAIEEERYEDAARIRDEIAALAGQEKAGDTNQVGR